MGGGLGMRQTCWYQTQAFCSDFYLVIWRKPERQVWGSRLLTSPSHTNAFPSLIPSPLQLSLLAPCNGLGMRLPSSLYSLFLTCSSPHTSSPSHSLSLPHTLPLPVNVSLRTRLNEVALILKSVTVLISTLREAQKDSSAKRELCVCRVCVCVGGGGYVGNVHVCVVSWTLVFVFLHVCVYVCMGVSN